MVKKLCKTSAKEERSINSLMPKPAKKKTSAGDEKDLRTEVFYPTELRGPRDFIVAYPGANPMPIQQIVTSSCNKTHKNYNPGF
jgi:hypothetical protein